MHQTSENSVNNTSSLRKKTLQQRKNLASYQQQFLSRRIANSLQQNRHFQAANTVAIYLPVNGEASPISLTTHPLSKHKQYYLPVLSPFQKHHLCFLRWHKKTLFKKNCYGIPEPVLNFKDIIQPKELDMVIAPLVCFDIQGNRIGMGGGYYDRTFAFKTKHRIVSTPTLTGFAYSFQKTNAIKHERWDVPLDAVVTERGFKQL